MRERESSSRFRNEQMAFLLCNVFLFEERASDASDTTARGRAAWAGTCAFNLV